MNIYKEESVSNRNNLIEWFEAGCKHASNYKIGTEHEKFVYIDKDLSPVGYEGERGIKKILQCLTRFGWEEIYEKTNLIALKKNKQSITLEPGGQLELSGAPLSNIHQTCVEVNDHLEQVKTVGKELGVSFLGLGARIDCSLLPELWMPKSRYDIMKKYMPSVGNNGLEMMADTSTVQVNLDYSSEKDMVKKLRVGLTLQPIVTAMFASSPLQNMKKSKYISRRAAIWLDVDPNRCGIPEIVFDDGFGFEMWTDYSLKVPMYFIRRNNDYINCTGGSFESFLKGDLVEAGGNVATIQDWEDHLSTIFTEVRLKQFIEMRGADAGPWKNLCALPALWVGLLYDTSSLGETEALAAEISIEKLKKMYNEVPQFGLSTNINGRTVGEYAKDLLSIAINGLKRRGIVDAAGNDERGYLKDLISEVNEGKSPADKILDIFNKNKTNYMKEIYESFSY